MQNPIDVLLSHILNNLPIVIIKGKVISVNRNECTCTVQPLNEDDAEITNVQFRAVVSDDNTQGVIIVPKQHSAVTVGFLYNNPADAMILKYSDFEDMWIKKGDNIFSVSDGVYINTADKTKKALIGPPTKDVLDKSIQRIDAIYTLLQLPAFYTTILAAVGDGGASYNTLLQTTFQPVPPSPSTANILSTKTYLE